MSNENDIPPPPEKPEPDSCCGSGCVPCIFDYYDQALMAWAEKNFDVRTYIEAENKATEYLLAQK